jgi:hypothetical protein
MALAFAGQAHMMIVVAQCHAQDFLGLLLLDHETVQVGFDVARLFVEGKVLLQRRSFGSLGRAGKVGLGWRGARQVLAHKFLQLTLKLLRRRRPIEKSFLHIEFNLNEYRQSAMQGNAAVGHLPLLWFES